MMRQYKTYLSRWSRGVSPEIKRQVYNCYAEHGPTTVGDVTERTGLEWSIVRDITFQLASNGLLKRFEAKHHKSNKWVVG